MARCLVSYQRSTYAATYGGIKCVEPKIFVSMVSTVKNQNSRKCLEKFWVICFTLIMISEEELNVILFYFLFPGEISSHIPKIATGVYRCKTFKTGFDGNISFNILLGHIETLKFKTRYPLLSCADSTFSETFLKSDSSKYIIGRLPNLWRKSRRESSVTKARGSSRCLYYKLLLLNEIINCMLHISNPTPGVLTRICL